MNKHHKNAKNDDYTMSAEMILSLFSFSQNALVGFEFICFYVACAIKTEDVIIFLSFLQSFCCG
jgi:hypothetical protein